MPAQPIYLDAEEEISELIERLRQTSAEDVPVVVPSRSRIGQSRFNFRLLRDYARQFGKRISIISPDAAVQQLATESGFSAFAGMDEFGILDAPVLAPATAPIGGPAAPAPIATPPRAQLPPAPAAARMPKLTMTPHKKLAGGESRAGRMVLYAGAALIALVALLFAAVLVPSVSITLTARAQPLTDTTDIVAAPNAAPVKVRQVTSTKDSSQQFKSSGVHDTAATAGAGAELYTNNCPGVDVHMHAGQILSTSSGIQFVQQADVTVKESSTASVNILAAAPGAAGNVPDHTITNINNEQGFISGCFSATNTSATGGGADEVKKTFVSQSDLDAAAAQLEGDLRGTLIDDLSKQASNSEKLADTVDYSSKVSADHAANDAVDLFDVTVTMTGNGAVYNVDDVKAALKADLGKKVPAGFALTDNPVKSDFHVSQSTSDGHISFTGTAEGFIAPKLDFQKVKARLLGSSTASARIYLSTLPIESADVKQKPFTLPLLPFLSSRIAIRYVVDTGATPVSPAPSPSPTG
jgi:hypothetical protein